MARSYKGFRHNLMAGDSLEVRRAKMAIVERMAADTYGQPIVPACNVQTGQFTDCLQAAASLLAAESARADMWEAFAMAGPLGAYLQHDPDCPA